MGIRIPWVILDGGKAGLKFAPIVSNNNVSQQEFSEVEYRYYMLTASISRSNQCHGLVTQSSRK